MSTFKPPVRDIFYPDEIEEMRDELSRGDVPDETMAEREARAQEIFERNRSSVEPEGVSDQT